MICDISFCRTFCRTVFDKSMASPVPAKSQPLHNFPLSHLKWKNNHQRQRSSSGSVSRNSSSSPHRSPLFSHGSPKRASLPPLHSPLRGADDSTASPSRYQSPMRPGVMDDSTAPPPPPPSHSPIGGNGAGKWASSHKNSKPLIEYRRQSKNSVSCSVKNGVSISSLERDVEEKSEKKLKGPESDIKESRSSKILIKFRPKASKIPDEVQVEDERRTEDNEAQEQGKPSGASDDDELLPKTWNLRPRRPIRSSLNLNGSGFKNNGSTVLEKRIQSPQMNHNSNNRSESQKKEKRKIGFTLTLSREEIEEDMYALIGSKPSRRPKKRSKAVQKVIDNLYPGAWLESITADSYKVSEHPGKG